MLPDDARHGTNAGRKAHQKEGTPPCEPCRQAAADYERHRQTRRYLARGPLVIANVGTARRIQGLMRIGWTGRELSSLLGREKTYCAYLLRTKTVQRETAVMVADLYARLCMTPRVGWMADRTRRMAEARGWAPPLSWDNIDDETERPAVARDTWDESSIDDAVIDRVLAGGKRPRKLTHAEAGEIVARSIARGMSGNQIEALYGLKPERYVRGGERVA